MSCRNVSAAAREAAKATDEFAQWLAAQSAGKTAIVLALAILFAYLFLVALYESWTMPVAVLLSVTIGLAASIVATGLVSSVSLTPRDAGDGDQGLAQDRVALLGHHARPRAPGLIQPQETELGR